MGGAARFPPARERWVGTERGDGGSQPTPPTPHHHCDICPLRQPVSTAYPGIPSCLTPALRLIPPTLPRRLCPRKSSPHLPVCSCPLPRLRGRARERGAPGTKRFHISVGALVAGSRPWPAKQPRPRNRKYPFQRHYSPVLTSENPIKKLICSLETPVSAPRTGRAGEVPAFAGMTGGARL